MKKRRERKGLFFIVLLLFLCVGIYMAMHINDIYMHFSELLEKDKNQPVEQMVQDRYARNLLSEEEQEIYDKIYWAVEKNEEKVRISSTETQKAVKVMEHYLADTPEHFWLENYSYMTQGNKVISFGFVYNRTEEEIKKDRALFEEKLSHIAQTLTQKNQTDYMKSKAIHDYLIEITTYTTAERFDIYTAFGPLVQGNAVCQGYGKAYQVLAQKMGLSCLYVKGVSREQNHGWNLVQLDGAYYHLDVTWDDIENEEFTHTDYSYLHLTEKEISKDHAIDRERNIALPKAESTKENYFVKNGLFLEDIEKNSQAVVTQIAKHIDNGEHYIQLAFTTQEAYEEALNNRTYVYTLLREGLSESNSTKRLQSSYNYMNNDDRYTLLIIFQLTQ